MCKLVSMAVEQSWLSLFFGVASTFVGLRLCLYSVSALNSAFRSAVRIYNFKSYSALEFSYKSLCIDAH